MANRIHRPISIAITVMLSLFALIFWQMRMDARAENIAAATLALACEGTVADKIKPDAKPEPISMGIVVNFTAWTVIGFRGANFPVAITNVDEVRISFRGLSSSSAFFAAVYGSHRPRNWGCRGHNGRFPDSELSESLLAEM